MAPAKGPNEALLAEALCISLFSVSCSPLSPEALLRSQIRFHFASLGTGHRMLRYWYLHLFAHSDGSPYCIRSSQICQWTWYIKLPNYLCPWLNRHPVGLRKEILPCTRMRKIGYSLVLRQLCFLGNCDYGPSTIFGHSFRDFSKTYWWCWSSNTYDDTGISLYNSTESSQHYSLLILPQGVGGPTRWFVNLFEAPLHLYGLRFPT